MRLNGTKQIHGAAWRRSVGASALALAVAGAHGGPLTPPAGPVGSTGKTIAEAEPRIALSVSTAPGDANSVLRITAPGSYYLTGNVTGQPGKHGIEVAASHVTIDLNGYALVGGAGSLSGIVMDGFVLSTVVRSGTVTEWGADGVNLDGTGADPGKRVELVIARNNGAVGIGVGDSGRVIDCTAVDNGGLGISGASATVISGCVARGNIGSGIVVGVGGSISGSTARLNGGNGFQGASASVINCAAHNNAINGFSGFASSVLIGCIATENSANGFSLSLNSRVSDCTAIGNIGEGFSASSTTSFTDCSATENGLNGFVVINNSAIRGCVARGNGTAGTGAGFRTTGSDNRLERNSTNGGDYGFQISGERNILIQNQSGGATTLNWSIAANNIYGPIIDRSAAVLGAASGDSATSTLNTTDPNANFTN